jgi:diguanylate cyclase (GGDEF)-like protein
MAGIGLDRGGGGMMLDTGTLSVVLAVMAMAMAGAMALLWRIHGDYPGISSWIASNLLQTVAILTLILRPQMPETLSIIAGNTTTAGGYLFALHGINRFTGQRPQIALSLGLLALVAGGFALLLAAGAPAPLRSALISSVNAIIALLSAWRLMTYGLSSEGMREVAMIAAGLHLFHTAFLAARVGLVLAAPPLGSLVVPNIFQHVLFFEFVVALVLASTLFILLTTRRLQTDLNRLAAIDALTGCYNRRALLELAEREVVRSERSAADLAVMMIDIDHFKPLNDTYGHAAGDAILTQVVERARATLRPVDLFGRYGGEEFCVVLPGLAPGDTMAVAERLRTAVAGSPCVVDDLSLSVSISLGVAHFGSDGRSVRDLIAAADGALYRAKTAGRNRVMVAATETRLAG